MRARDVEDAHDQVAVSVMFGEDEIVVKVSDGPQTNLIGCPGFPPSKFVIVTEAVFAVTQLTSPVMDGALKAIGR